MDIALYILAGIALVAFTILMVRAMRTLGQAESLMRETQLLLHDAKHDIDSISDDIKEMKTRILPVVENISVVTKNVSSMTEGLHSRMDDVYRTLDDVLDVAHGAIEDVERIKNNVVATIDAPISAVRNSTTGIVDGLVKGMTIIKELIGSFSKNGKS